MQPFEFLGRGKDPLAKYIPADQHVLFFPSFAAMTHLIDEAKANGKDEDEDREEVEEDEDDDD